MKTNWPNLKINCSVNLLGVQACTHEGIISRPQTDWRNQPGTWRHFCTIITMIRCPSSRDRHRTMQHLIDQLNWNYAQNWRIQPEVKLSLLNILLFSPCEVGDHLYDVIYTALTFLYFKSNNQEICTSDEKPDR